MRKIILNLAISVDGFIEGPNGEYDWCFTDQDYGMADFMNRIDSIFYGRKSYEVMLAAEASGENPFSKIKSYVFSNSLSTPFSGTQLVSGSLADEVNAIRRLPGKDIWLFGGAKLATSFLNEGLVDEMSLAIHPVLLGSGKPLFQNIPGRKKMVLNGSKEYSTGLVMVNYSLAHKV